MAQSDVQKLIQSLAGVQTQAQQGASNSANNGNPNTVYNQSAWGYGGPPAMNQQGEWSMNNLSRPPTIALGSWQPPAGWGSVGNGTGAVLPINGGIATNPNYIPETFPIDPTTGTPVVPPTTTTPLGGNGGTGLTDPAPGSSIGQGGLGAGGVIPTTTGAWLGGTSGNGYTHGGSTFGNPSSGLNLGTIGSAFENILNTARTNLGVGQEGFSLGQFLDAVTEPFLPGDFYNGQLQQGVNKPAAVTGVLNMVIPGVGNLADFLASKIPSSATGFLGRVRDFFARGDIQQGVDEIYRQAAIDEANGKNPRTNPYAGGTSPTGNFDGNIINWATINSWNKNPTTSVGTVLPADPNAVALTPEQLEAGYADGNNGGGGSAQQAPIPLNGLNPLGTRRDTRSGNSASSGVLASGEAAQDMVGNWQVSNWLQGGSQAAREAMTRMFGGKER